MKNAYLIATAIAVVATIPAASAQTVTPTNSQGWTAANVRGTGTVAITDTYKPVGQSGSLEFSTSGSNDKADFVNTWGLQSGRTLGSLSSLSYSFLRDASSSTAAFRAPAFRLSYYDQPTNASGYLIYEPVYNDYASTVPTGQFVTVDMTGENFWMRAFGPGRTIEKYDVTLAQWASGTQQAAGAHTLNANTFIYGIEVGVGSGWDGTFRGAVDNVNVAFGNDVVRANFEPNAVAGVPEPATWAMMMIGFGGIGFAMRARRRDLKVRFAA